MFQKIEAILMNLRPKVEAIHEFTGMLLKFLPEPKLEELSDLEQIHNDLTPTNETNT
jgi:hypothetical protein